MERGIRNVVEGRGGKIRSESTVEVEYLENVGWLWEKIEFSRERGIYWVVRERERERERRTIGGRM